MNGNDTAAADDTRPCEEEEQFFLSEELVQSPVHAAAGTTHIDFGGLLQPALIVHTDRSKGNGGATWPAGETLAKYLLREKRDVLQECSIVEYESPAPSSVASPALANWMNLSGWVLAAGLLAVAAGCAPTKAVRVTDQEPMLALMEHNIALNGLQGQVVASIYDWGSTRPKDISEHPDVVLAADCVYFEPAFPLLQQTLRDLIGPHTTCYFCFKRRRRADLHFMRKVKKDFMVEEVTDDPERGVYAKENITLCTIRMKRDR